MAHPAIEGMVDMEVGAWYALEAKTSLDWFLEDHQVLTHAALLSCSHRRLCAQAMKEGVEAVAGRSHVPC
jgi:hypothetical protein